MAMISPEERQIFLLSSSTYIDRGVAYIYIYIYTHTHHIYNATAKSSTSNIIVI